MARKVSGRLVIAIVSDLLEETAIVVIVLWGLPRIGINIPIWGLILIMVAWCIYSVITYRKGSQALRSKPMIGLPDMLGTKGKVVSPLAPDGLVKIKGELWVAEAESGEVKPGTEVVVVAQNRLKLVVRQTD